MATLADAILHENLADIRQRLQYGEGINVLDEYGFTPLIEAAIIDNTKISELLLKHGADPNQQDVTGGTALHWATENNNIPLAKLLLKANANPNACNFSGQSVLVMPVLRRQAEIKNLLIAAGADLILAQDFINTKLIGHLFELVGTVNIVLPNHQFVEVDFEGFYLEVTLGLISDALLHFQNHFAARQLRRFAGLANFIVTRLDHAAELIKYQQYRTDITKYDDRINFLLSEEPVIVPIGYEGHAITFIKYHDIWVKCDRREDSRLFDNIMFYRVKNRDALSVPFLKDLIYEKQSDHFINHELDRHLGLEPITELKIESQISGNCSWANVEATIPATFFLILMQMENNTENMAYSKTLALNFFHRFREWNKDRVLNFCIQGYQESDALRKASKAEILATILFERSNLYYTTDRMRIETILEVLINSPFQYILQNYLRVYYYETGTEEGRKFYHMLQDYGFKVK